MNLATVARGVVLFVAALGLGLTLALVRVGALATVSLTIGPPIGGALVPLPPRLPPAGAIAILTMLVVGLLRSRDARSQARLVLAGMIALVLVFANDLFALLAGWTALVFLDWAQCRTDDSDRRSDRMIDSQLRLIASGAPLLWFTVELADRGASSAGFILVGTATASLPPLSPRRRGSEPIADGILPIVGYLLAARGLLTDGSPALVGLIAARATFAIAWSLIELRDHRRIHAGPIVVGRILQALSFLLLALSVWRGAAAAVVGLSVLVAAGIVAILDGATATDPGEDPSAAEIEPMTIGMAPSHNFASIDPLRRVSSAGTAEGAATDPLLVLWDRVEELAEQWSRMLASLEDRYALAVGLLVVLIAIVGWPV